MIARGDFEESDAAAENVCDEFVDYLNARDLDAIAEMVGEEVTSNLFDGSGVEAALHGLSDFVLRYPQLIASRAEDGTRPLVALWVPDESDRYRLMGHLDVSSDDELIDRITYVDTDVGDLVVEEPDPDELAEWQNWPEWESGESGRSDDGTFA